MGTPVVPTIELAAPRGGRVVVAPRSPDDRLGDLADALGLDPRHDLELDGRPIGRHETLGRAGLLRGSRLRTSSTPRTPSAPEPLTPAVVMAIVTAGPAAGTVVALAVGRHVVGRSPAAAVPIADPLLEPHHAVLDVDADGSIRLVQLTGRVPVRVAGATVDGRTAVPDGATVFLGASRLRVGTGVVAPLGPDALTVASADPWRRSLHRTPRARPQWDPTAVALPASTAPSRFSSGVGLMAALCTMLGSVVVALVMRSPMFLVLGAVGVLASVAMWIGGRVRAARDGRRAGAVRQREIVAFAAAVAEQRGERWRHHLATTPTVTESIAVATTCRADVWARRVEHGDAFRATLGWGSISWDVAVSRRPEHAGEPIAPELLAVISAAECFDDAPVPVDLGAGAMLAVAGWEADAVVRALVVQLATWTGPADWRLIVVTDDPAAWDWCRWLPHGPTGAATVVAADGADAAGAMAVHRDDGDDRHVIVVTDRADLLAQRTGPLRRFLDAARSAAVVVCLADGDAVPAMCRSIVEVGSIGIARWWPDSSDAAHVETLHAAGITAAVATRVTRALAGLRDPEDPTLATDALASSVTLGALSEHHGPGPIDDAIAIAAAWRAAGPDPTPVAPLGLTVDGVVAVDLVRDGPHALIAGTTGAGKSELLRTLVVSMAARCSPDHVTFVLVDYKGGSTFDACAELPHTVGLVTDLDERLAERALVSLEAELRRRERLLRAVGVADLTGYRIDPARPPLPRLVVVIDEFAALAAELPTFLPSLVGIAQRGRSLGVHLILATQRPAGVVDDDIRANTNLRLALRLVDAADARDIVGDDGPVRFPRGTPGRTMLRLGPGETVVFQSARCTGPVVAWCDERLQVVADVEGPCDGELTELAVLVRSIRHAAALSDVAPPHRPWLPPLPDRLDEAPPDGAVGVVDLPGEQRLDDLRWLPSHGHLALLGSFGSGTTTALVAVLMAACREQLPDERHVYVVDGRGDGRLDALTRSRHCGGVVRLHEDERLGRLLDRLVDQLDRRRATTADESAHPLIVLAVDGLGPLRAALDQPSATHRWDQLLRIVGEGPAVGVTVVVTAERPSATPPAVLAACAERWIFHLDDPGDAALCGLRSDAVPAAIPGRIVVASSGCAAQVAEPDLAALAEPGGQSTGGPPPIEVLGSRVDAATLPAGRRTATGDVELAVGIEFRRLDVARLVVPDGEHVLVAGPPRSGRTTALDRLVESWSEAMPDGTIVAVKSRRGEAVEVADIAEGPDRPCLVVVDDAEHVEDATGALAAIISERRTGVLVIAAGRPDALRSLYGHWTSILRRSRLGLLMSACSDADGDVLGELLPRHRPLAARPGLAWVVSGGGRMLVQVGACAAVDVSSR